MARRFKYYAIIGNNGYGMSPDWSEIKSFYKYLQSECHQGFQTEEEAYEWIWEQAGRRSKLKTSGLCDLITLRNQHLVLVKENLCSENKNSRRRPAEIEEVHSIGELNQSMDGMNNRKKRNKKEHKRALLKDIEKLLDEYWDED